MRAVKWIVILVLAYVGIVVLFESLIGWFQPSNESTLVITTRAEDGSAHERVVSRLESDGTIYVAANHWPRAWYRQALADPQVEAAFGGSKRAYTAVPLEGAEEARVDAEHPLPLPFRFLTGFPPRELMRLDPR